VVLHPLWGTLLLVVTLFLMFQAVFSWAEPLMDGIEGLVSDFGQWVHGVMPDGVLRSLLVDGVIAGTGSVVVFLPQILILFFFILVLEDSGYLPRAAFCWTASWAAWACRTLLHPAAVQLCLCRARHHGHAFDLQLARPSADHHDRAADDLLGTPAGVHAADRAFIPSRPWPASSICRAWCCLPSMWAASSVPWPWPGWASWPPRSRPARRC
jgi:hypothetical protein